ncbi:MAG TPA: hypothetical protein K8W13_00975 [Enterococcus columbae]|nr:hypothetical protein [Enterococcus columbae]
MPFDMRIIVDNSKIEKINAIISLIPSMMVQFQCEGAQVKDIELAPQVKL